LSRECSRDGAAGHEVRQSHNIAAAAFKPYCAALLHFVLTIFPPHVPAAAYDPFCAMVENKFASSIGNGNTIVEPRSLAMSNNVPR
jgi:hypothetical protein